MPVIGMATDSSAGKYDIRRLSFDEPNDGIGDSCDELAVMLAGRIFENVLDGFRGHSVYEVEKFTMFWHSIEVS